MASPAQSLKAQGNAAFKQRDFGAAISLYTQAASAATEENDPVVLSESLHNRGQCKLKESRFAEALADFRESVLTRPAYHKARLAAAAVLLDHLGDPAAAVSLLQQALADPNCDMIPAISVKRDAALLALSQVSEARESTSPADSIVLPAPTPMPAELLRVRLTGASCVSVGTPPAPRLQRFDIARLSAQYAATGTVEGAEYALMPATWWADWSMHVGGFSEEADVAPVLRILRKRNSLDFGVDDPDVIAHYPAVAASAYASLSEPEALRAMDCLALVDLEGTAAAMAAADGLSDLPQPRLHPEAQEVQDFVVVGLEVWRALAAWHGTRGPPLIRVAVRVPPAPTGAGAEEGLRAAASPTAVVIDLRPELRRYEAPAVEAPTGDGAVAPALSDVAAVTPALSDSAAAKVDEVASPFATPPAVVASTPAVVAAAAPPPPPLPLVALSAADATAPATATPPKPVCSKCGASPADLKCSRCKASWYCSPGCQKEHWPVHKKGCGPAAGAVAVVGGGAALALNGRVGLANLGNTCFMNSSLQALAATWPLSQVFLSGAWEKLLNRENKLGTGGRLAAAYADLMRGLWRSPPGTRSVAPVDVKRAVAGFQDRFSGFAQHDAQELLNYLVDGLHEDLNSVRERTYVEDEDVSGRPDAEVAPLSWGKYRARNNSVVADLFAGQLKSTLVCPHCERVSVSFDPYTMLSLPLPTNPSRNVVVLLQRSPYECSLPGRLTVPSLADVTGGAASASLLAGHSPLESDPLRERPWEGLGFVLPKTGTVADVRAAVARETGIPSERLVFAWERPPSRFAGSSDPEYGFLTTDALPMTQVVPRPQPDACGQLLAYELPPAVMPARVMPSSAIPTSSGDSAENTERAAAAAVALPAPEQRLIVRVYHYTSTSPSSDDSRDDPTKRPAPAVARETSMHGPPTVFGLPESASVGTIRLAIARSVLPVLHKPRLRALLGCSVSAGDDIVVWRLAQELPLFSSSNGATAWLPTFSDDGATEGSIRDVARVVRSFAGNAVEICIAWRGRFAPILTQKRVLEFAPTPSLGKLISAMEQTKSAQVSGLTLGQCFEVFTQPETLDEANKWYCNRCKDHVMASKTLQVWSLPEILVVHLKRFEARNIIVRDKINTLVSCPLTGLDLSGYDLQSSLCPPAGAGAGTPPAVAPAIYDCYAVVNHYGQMFGGHYTAFVNHDVAKEAAAPPESGGSWLEMDDSSVTTMKAADVITPAAYVVFYRRRRLVTPPPSPGL